MASTSSQSKRYEGDTLPKRPVMPRDIFDAAMKGHRDVLIERLGLQTKEQTQIQEARDSNHESTKDLSFGSELMPLTQKMSPFVTKSNVTIIKASHSALQHMKTEHQIVQSELQSGTHFGDTVLHLLVTKMHNELALMIFQRDMSLLKAQNMMLETPLHCAAKVGNREVVEKLIQIDPTVVNDALQETNEKGDTALHVAIRCDFEDISIKLMKLDRKIAYKVNRKMLTPFYVVIEEDRCSIAEKMIKVDPNLACTQFFDGMFPIHLAACKGIWRVAEHIMQKYSDYAKLVDPCGRNLFHFAAEESKGDFLRDVRCEDSVCEMRNATDYEGNTPLHIAAMKGDKSIVQLIWRMGQIAETVRNKKGLTPYEIFKRQLLDKDSKWIISRIHDYEQANGNKFSKEWFTDVMGPPPPSLENKWERTQVIGLGNVLITTVTFAAAFTIPGGYNQDHGTPILGRRYMFWAFILANTLAFIQGFISLFALLINALPGIHLDTLEFSSSVFLLAATSMVMAFGLGLHVTLAPACLPIAIIVLVITLLIGSPALLIALGWNENMKIITNFFCNGYNILAIYALSLLFIFCLALLSLI